MATASVLLHVAQRKKVIKIPLSCSRQCAFLCEKVLEWTGEAVDYFEKYDAEWDDWIELEQGFELHDKNRVGAVVSTSISKVSKC